MRANRSLSKGFGAALSAVALATVCVSPTPAATPAERLETTIVPKVEIRGVTLETALEYLRFRSAELRSASGAATGKGINFILKDPDGTLADRKVSLELTKVPLKVVLDYITRGAGATYRIDADVIVVAKRQFLSIGGGGIIPQPPGATKAIVDRLRGTTLPEFSIKDATIDEAAQVLRALSSPPINFVVRHPRPEKDDSKEEHPESVNTGEDGAEVGAEKVAEAGGAEKEKKKAEPIEISLHLTDVAMGTALMYACELAGLHFTVHPNAIMIGEIEDIIPRKRDPGSHAYGRSGVRKGGEALATKLRSLIIPEVNLNSVTLEQALELVRAEARNAEKRAGVATPSGINIVNMARKEEDETDQAISMTLSNIPAWDLLGYITNLTDTEFRVEPSAVVVEWSLPRKNVADAGAKPNPLRIPQPPQVGLNFPVPVIPSTPQEFTTRNVGSSMTVQPVVGSDGRTIDLGISIEHSEFEGFIDYGNGVRVPMFSRRGITRQ